MNKATLSGSWTELKGHIKQRWSKLTDNDMGIIEGNLDELVGRVQQAYGCTKDKAWAEFEEFKSKMNKVDSTPVAGREDLKH